MSTHQVGSGSMPVFKGYQSQYGRGLGNVLSGLLRAAVPIVGPVIKNIGRSLLSAGANRLQNEVESRLGPWEDRPLRSAPKTRRTKVVKRKRTNAASSVRKRKKKTRGRTDIFET